MTSGLDEGGGEAILKNLLNIRIIITRIAPL